MEKNQFRISYLACPFSHSNPEIREMRLLFVNRVALEFHQQGKFIYSPLTHNIPLAQLSKHTCNWNTWEQFDKSMLMRCDELIVLKLSGWENSQGVSAEIEFAKQINLPIQLINPSEHFNVEINNDFKIIID